MTLDNRYGVDVRRAEALGAVVASHGTLLDVVRWVASRGDAARMLDVVVQDEFTHDVVVRAGELFLVYDTT